MEIKASLIIEIMGRPPEHLKETLNTLIIRMGSEKGVKLLDKKYHDPAQVENVPNLFTCFAEVNVEFETIEHMFNIIMGYMPSHVEVYEPEKHKLDTHQINSLANYLVSKLHKYDEMAKGALAERDILLRQMNFLKNGGKFEDLMKINQRAAEAQKKAMEQKAPKEKPKKAKPKKKS